MDFDFVLCGFDFNRRANTVELMKKMPEMLLDYKVKILEITLCMFWFQNQVFFFHLEVRVRFAGGMMIQLHHAL